MKRLVRAGALALALILSLAAQSVTPQSQAAAARQVVNNDVVNYVTYANARLASQYGEAVRQWIANKQQVKAGTPLPPVPNPPASWQVAPHAYTPSEAVYDKAYPGIPPLVDDAQTGPPVAPQYVPPPDPVAPPAFNVAIGINLFGPWYQALASDTCPAGYMTTKDGHTYRKAVYPFGGWWEQIN